MATEQGEHRLTPAGLGFQAAGMLGQSIEQSGLLPKGLPALLYVRVATINGCPF